MIDTHCHLQMDAYDADRASMLDAAREAGVQAFVVPAIDYASFPATLAMTKDDDVFCALGIHPHHATEWSSAVKAEVEKQLITNPKVVAVGEIGLDYHYDYSPRDVQRAAFSAQIALAITHEKPIVVHVRESDDDVLMILREHYALLDPAYVRGHLHCFSGTSETLSRALELGFMVSFTGNITFKNSTLSGVVGEAPIDRIMLETDAPFMTPPPDRGKRNVPQNIVRVAEKIAEIKGIAVSEVLARTTENARRLFGIAVMLLLVAVGFAHDAHAQVTGPVGGKPPDSVMTDDRRKMEEAVRKQREELAREEEQRRQDSIKAVQKEQEENARQAQEQVHQDSIKAAERIAADERARLKALTPITWKAIGIGGGLGIGNIPLTQGKASITPTSVFAWTIQGGTQITRVLDFDIGYTHLVISDNLTSDNLYNRGIGSPIQSDNLKRKVGSNIPTFESLTTTSLSFDLRLVITPRNAFKFYAGIGYVHLNIASSQQYHKVLANPVGPASDTNSIVDPTLSTYESSFGRGGIKLLFGVREDIELGDKFILTPFAEISAMGAFAGTQQAPSFVFQVDRDQITMTHLNIGAVLYFGWFGVQRYSQ